VQEKRIVDSGAVSEPTYFKKKKGRILGGESDEKDLRVSD